MARVNQTFTVTGTAQRIASSQTLGDRLFVQMRAGSAGIGYVLSSNTGAMPSKSNDNDIVVEIVPGTSSGPGIPFKWTAPGGGNLEDMGSFWVDGSNNGDKIGVSYSKR